MDPPTSGSVKPYNARAEYSRDELNACFIRRVQPILCGLEDFREKEFENQKVSFEENAIVELLKWRDDSTVEVSKGFREFYDGLLFFSNLHSLALQRPLRELVDIFFEIHGSDPRIFPEALKIGIRLLHQALAKLALNSQQNGLWAVLAEASDVGSQAADMLRISLEHYKAKLPVNALGDPYGKLVRGEEWAQLPFASGFKYYVRMAQHSTFKDIAERLTPEGIQSLLEPPLGAAPSSVDWGINEELLPSDLETDGYTQIFVGPSGCGKTSKIQSLLKRDWGFYLLPGNLPKESNENELKNRMEYKPRRGDGSRDTQTWFERAKSLQELGLSYSHDATTQAGHLLSGRLWILQKFREQDRHPCDWLKLQTNCRKPQNDVFNHLYRVLRFTGYPLRHPLKGSKSRLIFCFDEAQCDLPAIAPGEMKWWYHSEEVRPLACMYIAAFEVNSSYHYPKNLGIFLSGTALQLHHIERLIKSYAPLATEVVNAAYKANIFSNYLDFVPKVNRNFGLVTGNNFGKLMKARKYHHDEGLLKMISQNSELLHGRVMWSVCYLDEIDELIKSQDGEQREVLDQHVKEVSRRIYDMAKKGLKERLEDMRRPRQVDHLSGDGELTGTMNFVHDVINDSTNRLYQLKTGFLSTLEGVALDSSTRERVTLDLCNIISNFERVVGDSHDLWSILGPDSRKDTPEESKQRIRAFLKAYYHWDLYFGSEELGPFKADQHEGLIDELCSLAIRSDLLGEATIFTSPESADLVAFGFAFLDGSQELSGSRVKLKERVAVDAAIEYFQGQVLSNGQSEYDRALINFLYSEQSNASALGKVAELFFAWHLKKVLGACADMIIPTLRDDYRAQVLELLFGDAQTVEDLETRSKGVDLRSQINGHGGDLSAFHLVEGRRTAYQEEVDEERTITVWDWLRNIRHGWHGDDLQSTFWFPSNNTGPDVLFALKSGTPYRTWEDAGGLDYSLVLCAVQIKREKGIDVGRAIATTNPNYWFSSNYPHHTRDAREITRELRDWQERYPIVRILVSALTGPSQYKKAEERPTTAKKYFGETGLIIPSHQQYFTSIGAEHDDLLFGDAFRRLRKAQGIETTRERRGEA